MAKVEKKKKKNVVVEAVGQAHVQSTFNNIKNVNAQQWPVPESRARLKLGLIVS